MVIIEALGAPWDEAERWSRLVIALSGAGLAAWAFLRWPVVILLKGALLAAMRAAMHDEAARESFARALREQLLDAELARLTHAMETLEYLDRRVDALEGGRKLRSGTGRDA